MKLLVAWLVMLFWLPAAGATESVCDKPWVTEYRAGLNTTEHLRFVGDTDFEDGGRTYAAGLVLREDGSGSLVIFGVRASDVAEVVSEVKFSHALPGSELRARMAGGSSSCTMPRLYQANAEVRDLDGDGRIEVVLQSMPAGTCADCPTLVQVLQLNGDQAKVIVEERCIEASIREGTGLVCRSVSRGVDGRRIFVEKVLFLKSLWER